MNPWKNLQGWQIKGMPNQRAADLSFSLQAFPDIKQINKMTEPAMIIDHDAYISNAPEDLRPVLVRLRAQLARTLPDAEEIIAYNMPTFRIGKTIVAGYAAFSKQCGLDLAPSTILSHADGIAAAGLKATKTGVTFSPRQPIPDSLVEQLALASRRDQIP